MTYAAAALAVVFFVVAFERFGVVPAARRAIERSRGMTTLLRDRALPEEKKERLLRRASVSLAGDVVSIGARGLGAVAVSSLPPLGFDLAGLARFDAVTGWLATWEAILLVSAAVGLGYLLWRGLAPRRA